MKRLLVPALLVLASCGGGDETSDETTSPPATAASTPARSDAPPSTEAAATTSESTTTTAPEPTIEDVAQPYADFVESANERLGEINRQFADQPRSVEACEAVQQVDIDYQAFLLETDWPSDLQEIVDRLIVATTNNIASFDTAQGTTVCVGETDPATYEVGTELRLKLGLDLNRTAD